MNEPKLPELIDASGDLEIESSVAIEGRRLLHMVSLRLEPEMLAALRDIADQRGVTVSDLLRAGAAMVIASNEQAMGVTQISVGVHLNPPPRSYSSTVARHTGNAAPPPSFAIKLRPAA